MENINKAINTCIEYLIVSAKIRKLQEEHMTAYKVGDKERQDWLEKKVDELVNTIPSIEELELLKV